MMGGETPELTVLLHESEQVTALIERSQTTANTLFGVVLPAAGALLLFGPAVGEIPVQLQFLGVFFAAVVSLALIFNAGLWIEIARYTRYKYLILFPRIYEVANLTGKESLGHFLAVEHLKERDLPAKLFQTIALGVSVAISSWVVVGNTTNLAVCIVLLSIIGIFATCAVVANVCLGRQVKKAFQEIAAQRPELR